MSDITLTVSAPGPTVDLTADAPGAVTVTVESGGGVSSHAGLPDLATSGHPVSVITGALSAATAATTYQPLDSDLTAVAALTTPATTISGAAQKASNLSDLASASSARTNLGLGGAATLSVGTTAGTVAAGDDSRFSGGGGVSPMVAPNGQGSVQWDIPGATFTSVANANFDGGYIHYQPFRVEMGHTITITAIGIRVHTLAASGHAILGCYATTAGMQPTGSSLLSSGVLDTSSTGVKQTTGLSVTLSAGVYLISMGVDVSVRLYTMRGPGLPGAQGFYNWDYSTTGFIRSRTYDGSNPSSPPAWNDNYLNTFFDWFFGLKYTVGLA